ncbi:hypothetical protein [Trinickia dinghuensis]|uniref:Uncharacterized protein n=1 Tax=Trinickia dinghuensis TaxID=2291023 RepID=A0A3D8JTT9_9BURK|nr:hypothetical protein [Trinickia dinghuensis]RDU96300.1 hypothetical protein DWV00_24695 [Trinickia dinghuensis]
MLSTDATPTGVIRLDVEQVLGRLRDAVGQENLDRYLVSCAAVQFWADLLAHWKSGGAATISAKDEINRKLRRAESAADCAAQGLLGRVLAAHPIADDLSSVCLQITEDFRLASVSKLIHLPMPECCGYDLADLELIAGDGERLTAQVGISRPVLIVGIRSGGTYLAPLWKAALTELGVADAHWCTVRPQSTNEAIDELEAIQAWIDGRFAPVVVVVDDRPDTGDTMERVAAMLREPGVDLWFSSVGQLWHGPAGRAGLVQFPTLAVRGCRDLRLWECLLTEDHPRFIERLRRVPGLPALPHDVQLQFRCSHGELRYGSGRTWLPWNDPKILQGRRPLVNPRKTPVAVCGADSQLLLHLRFIGEGVFGRAEFRTAQNMDCARRGWFIDGYVATADIGPSEPFRERFHAASQSVRADLLAQAAGWITVLTRQVVALAHDGSPTIALGPRWSAVMDAMQESRGLSPVVPERLSAFLTRRVPWLGQTGKAIRSSLRYACGGWHWRVDHYGRLHRFQAEANWGDVSFPELELAAFALENRLPPADARVLASLCGQAYPSVRESLPLAALTIAEARVRSVRAVSDAGRIALCQDFRQLMETTAELAGFEAL